MSNAEISEAAELLSVKQVATLLGCIARDVTRMADRGAMPRPLKLGYVLIRWKRVDVEKWLANGCPRIVKGGQHV